MLKTCVVVHTVVTKTDRFKIQYRKKDSFAVVILGLKKHEGNWKNVIVGNKCRQQFSMLTIKGLSVGKASYRKPDQNVLKNFLNIKRFDRLCDTTIDRWQA